MVDLLNFSLSVVAKHCKKPEKVAFCVICPFFGLLYLDINPFVSVALEAR